jgi:GH15 family glucan-1,4-alpha-glucosidase
MQFQPIENYGIIGDLRTIALAGMDGSIDFLCLPRIDSPSVFARLLDHERGGYFRISPIVSDAQQKQIYVSDTNVLLTRFLSESGVAEISDFMPVTDPAQPSMLVRRVKTVRGDLEFEMVCQPAFDYARADHRVDLTDDGILFISDDDVVLRLRTQRSVKIENGAAHVRFRLGAGETAAFILEYVDPDKESKAGTPHFVPDAFKDTVNFWHSWINQSKYDGLWREEVNRSALTLKLLTSRDYGSIVAAPTFGLPETIGGERNWDYRYTWIRDASFTLYSLIRLGYTSETAAFMKWIEDRCSDLQTGESLQVMYGIDGHADLEEEILEHLSGYRDSKPVRIGNGAANQLQLDIYGELMDSVYLFNKYGEPISHDLWNRLVPLVDYISEAWNQPDEGIWEIRGGRQHFLFSRLMSWVAIDRGLRLAKNRSFPAPIEAWTRARDEIYHDIFNNFWDDKVGAFVQHLGTNALDASSLLMPLMKFISPTDPRWLSHLDAVERELVSDSLVYRYSFDSAAPDGLTGDEGTFSICTFWYVECLSRAGEVNKARFYFEKMLGYANHLGLYAEEIGPRGEQLGNFPQAFTHLALISAAYDINRRLKDDLRS